MVGRSSSDDHVKPPPGLKASGRRLWAAVTGPYVLTPAEVEMLGQACRTADELDRLERAVRELSDLVTTGSTGQLKPHPLLAEVRAHRTLLERLTTALNLPDDTEEVGSRAGSRHARRAAEGRWRKKTDEGNGKLAELRSAGVRWAGDVVGDAS
jgi:hypothetical protein